MFINKNLICHVAVKYVRNVLSPYPEENCFQAIFIIIKYLSLIKRVQIQGEWDFQILCFMDIPKNDK